MFLKKKSQNFLKCGLSSENGRKTAKKQPNNYDLPKILAKIFLILISQKLKMLSRNVALPPKRKNCVFLGGRFVRYMELIPDIISADVFSFVFGCIPSYNMFDLAVNLRA